MASRNDVDSGTANQAADTHLAQYSASPPPASQWPGLFDPLSQAVIQAGRARDAQEEAVLAAARESQAAKNKLAQEGLIADIGAMRKQFPDLMEDMKKEFPTVPFGSRLSLDQINQGLKDQSLSQEDKNLLAVFKAGFNVLNESNLRVGDDGTHPTGPYDEISASSLAMIDKAVNRSISGDPYFKEHIWDDMFASGTKLALAAGAAAYWGTRSAKTAFMAAAVADIGGQAIGAASPLYTKFSGGEDQIYDRVKDEYLTFSDVFDKAQTPPDGKTR